MLQTMATLVLLATVAVACSSPRGSAPPPTPSLSTVATPTAVAHSPSPTGTSPGGSSLTPAVAGTLAQSISFVSPSQAWALAGSGCGRGVCAVVLHTADRGQHWRQVARLAASLGNGNGDVSEIRFADPENGWAFDPALWTTHDGGVHWHEVPMPGPVVALEAASLTAWAVVESCALSSGPQCSTSATLQRAEATSDNWQPVKGVAIPPGEATLALQRQAVYLLASGSPATFLLAADGTHFSHLPDPCQGGFQPSGLAASTPRDLAVVCAGNGAAGSLQKHVLLSSDAGRTYRSVADAPLPGAVRAIAAASPSTVAIGAASGGSWVYRTAGQDTAWTTPLGFGDGGLGWNDLGFTDAQHGVVVYAPPVTAMGVGGTTPPGVGTIYLTDDGGATWHATAINP